MNNTQAMNQIDAAMRALFANFVERAKAEQPHNYENIVGAAYSVAVGNSKLVYQVEMLPIGIRLEAGVAHDGELSRIFDGVMDGELIPATGSPLWQ